MLTDASVTFSSSAFLTQTPAAPAGRQTAYLIVAAALALLVAFPLVPAWPRTMLWLAAIGAGALGSRQPASRVAPGPGFDARWCAVVLVVALLFRIVWLTRVPQGLFIDEVLTMRNTLVVMERPFDPFGMTPLADQGWVATSNLYLYFNTLVVRVFGVSLVSAKLFSVIPGVLGCLFFYLAATRLVSAPVAGVTGLLMAVAHWHVRLSRYGWDATFLIMLVAASVWLLLRAGRQRTLPAYLAGVATGLGLYTYVNARCVAVALLIAVGVAALADRERRARGVLLAFGAALLITAAPLLVWMVQHPEIAWVRTAELSIFGKPDPVGTLLHNLLAHLLMFHVRGGLYARDNHPGLPMLDLLTGLLFLAGLVMLWRARREPRTWLLALLFAGALGGGILSVSNERAPYVYRASASIVPALLIAGLGLQGLLDLLVGRAPMRAQRIRWLVCVPVVIAAAIINAWWYFGLEPSTPSATRVMSGKYRVMAEAIRRSPLTVYLTESALGKLPNPVTPEDPFADVNGDVRYEFFGGDVLAVGLMTLAGDYDVRRSVNANYAATRIGMIPDEALAEELELPIAILFGPADSARVRALRARYADRGARDEALSDPSGRVTFHLLTIDPATATR